MILPFLLPILPLVAAADFEPDLESEAVGTVAEAVGTVVEAVDTVVEAVDTVAEVVDIEAADIEVVLLAALPLLLVEHTPSLVLFDMVD